MNTRVLVAAVMSALSVSTGSTVEAGQAAAIPVPVLDPPPKVVSLHRPQKEWNVVTTITLAIKPTTNAIERAFRWSDPTHGELACNGLAKEIHQTSSLPAGTTSISCTYQPAVGFKGIDTFVYDAQFKDGAFTEQATVTIEVRERGLRWEFKTNASTITSDAPDPEALAQIPDILGGTSQDFLFTLNWQTLRPRRSVENPNTVVEAQATQSLLRKADLRVKNSMASRTANFLVETGVQSEAVAATVVDVGPAATVSSSGDSQTGTTSEQSAARRNMVLRGEFNYNAGFNADGAGRFVEFGGVGKGSFSSVLDSNESFKEAVGRVLQVVPKDRTAYKLDGGFRLAIKQAHELDTTTLVGLNGQTEEPTNIENMFLLEFTLRFDSAVSGLATDSTTGDSRKRWALRAEFSPEIAGLPGHQLSTIGFEVSRALDGGSPAVKILYGMNLSATKGIFRN